MNLMFPQYGDDIVAVARLVQKAGSIWMLTHENPDGDAIGSSLALHLTLKSARRRVRTFFPERLPRAYSWLPGAEEVEYTQKLPDEFPDMVIVTDAARLERLGSEFGAELEHLRASASQGSAPSEGTSVVNIDHHVSNAMFGHVNVVIPEAAATAEIIFALFREMGASIPPGAVVNLYAAVLTDTGRFSYRNTTSRTFEMAAELVEHGVNPSEVAQRIYSQRTPSELVLLGRVLAQIVTKDELGYYYSYISQAMLQECQCSLADTEGVIEVLRTLASPPVCFLFKEHEGGIVKVSIRSDSGFDANDFASRFKGGGHPGAAGFTFTGSLKEAFAAVEQAMLDRARGVVGEEIGA